MNSRKLLLLVPYAPSAPAASNRTHSGAQDPAAGLTPAGLLLSFLLPRLGGRGGSTRCYLWVRGFASMGRGPAPTVE